MLGGVAEQVAEHLAQPELVTAHRQRLIGELELPAVRRAGHPGVTGGFDRQPGQVDRLPLQRAARVQPGQQQKLVDEVAHPGGFGFHPVQRVQHVVRDRSPVAEGQLGVPADGGQRRAKFVAGVRGEAAQPALARGAPLQGRLHVLEHPVERRANLTDFGVRVVVGDPRGQADLGVQRQFGHHGRGGGHPAQRPQRQPDQPDPAARHEQDHDREHGRFGDLDDAQVTFHVLQRETGEQHRAAAGLPDGGQLIVAAERRKVPGKRRHGRRRGSGAAALRERGQRRHREALKGGLIRRRHIALPRDDRRIGDGPVLVPRAEGAGRLALNVLAVTRGRAGVVVDVRRGVGLRLRVPSVAVVQARRDLALGRVLEGLAEAGHQRVTQHRIGGHTDHRAGHDDQRDQAGDQPRGQAAPDQGPPRPGQLADEPGACAPGHYAPGFRTYPTPRTVWISGARPASIFFRR